MTLALQASAIASRFPSVRTKDNSKFPLERGENAVGESTLMNMLITLMGRSAKPLSVCIRASQTHTRRS